MIGMNAKTGKPLGGIDHLRQSVADILTTPLGSRVMLREYGSNLPDLVDRPGNLSTLVDVYAAAATALDRWEPRLRLTNVTVNTSLSTPGSLVLDIEGIYTPDGSPVLLEGIQIS